MPIANDVDKPVTTMILESPGHEGTPKGLLITRSTDHSLLVSDMGPGGQPGILITYYRYYRLGTTPTAFLEDTAPFEIEGPDGPYAVEYYSQDAAGNIETVRFELVCLVSTP